ncbi:MAG: DNA-binding response regulator [Rhodospirillales bacterium]|nr:DNA-binding response regulator [Rhodospirillales bacterium]
MAVGRKILIVDDDGDLRHALAEQLSLHEEFLTAEADTGGNALECVGQQYFDAILLDVGLPDMDGRELCRLMRRSGVRAPILMLTGADSDADAILGLDSGANRTSSPMRGGSEAWSSPWFCSPAMTISPSWIASRSRPARCSAPSPTRSRPRIDHPGHLEKLSAAWYDAAAAQEKKSMAVGRKILIVDDDGDLRHALAEQLSLHEEFLTAEADTGGNALECVGQQYFDAILLDVGLPDMDGRELCRLMRRSGVRAPILMLTGADSDADAILGLDSGANDYITKPFKLSVLLARLRAQLRQHEQSEDAVFTIGPYSFRPSAKLMIDGSGRKKVRLTEKETAILKYLYRAGERVIGRDVLLGEVWGYNAGVTTHTLETHIYRLRQKIEREPSRAEILITEPGGYRLVP